MFISGKFIQRRWKLRKSNKKSSTNRKSKREKREKYFRATHTEVSISELHDEDDNVNSDTEFTLWHESSNM